MDRESARELSEMCLGPGDGPAGPATKTQSTKTGPAWTQHRRLEHERAEAVLRGIFPQRQHALIPVDSRAGGDPPPFLPSHCLQSDCFPERSTAPLSCSSFIPKAERQCTRLSRACQAGCKKNRRPSGGGGNPSDSGLRPKARAGGRCCGRRCGQRVVLCAGTMSPLKSRRHPDIHVHKLQTIRQSTRRQGRGNSRVCLYGPRQAPSWSIQTPVGAQGYFSARGHSVTLGPGLSSKYRSSPSFRDHGLPKVSIWFGDGSGTGAFRSPICLGRSTFPTMPGECQEVPG